MKDNFNNWLRNKLNWLNELKSCYIKKDDSIRILQETWYDRIKLQETFHLESINELYNPNKLFELLKMTKWDFLLYEFEDKDIKLSCFKTNSFNLFEIDLDNWESFKDSHKIYRFFDKELNYIWRFEIIKWTNFWNVYIDNESLRWKWILNKVFKEFIFEKYNKLYQWNAISGSMLKFLKNMEREWLFIFEKEWNNIWYYKNTKNR